MTNGSGAHPNAAKKAQLGRGPKKKLGSRSAKTLTAKLRPAIVRTR
jgi:hypothetical protein